MAKAVVFDFDGTLLDSEPEYADEFRRLLGERGVSLEANPPEFHGLGLAATVQALKKIFPGKTDWDDFGREFGARFLDCTLKARLFDGALELLESLDGQMPLAVCSNSPSQIVEAGLRAKGISKFFSAVVARDSVSKLKPNPEPYLKACALLGFAPGDCAAVEDSLPGLEAASGAGCRTVFFNSNGYRLPEPLKPRLVVSSLRELKPELLEKI